MPHKRAKLSARQNERAKRGTDLPPSIGFSVAQEVIPKSMTRVLQAEVIRKAHREKRIRNFELEKVDEGQNMKRRKKDQGEGHRVLEIKHGESLARFSRRVEDDMRVSMAEAIHASRNAEKRTRKVDAETENSAAIKTPASKSQVTPANSSRRTEFERRPSTTRLNDVPQAPPSLTKIPRGALESKGRTGVTAGKADGVISMAQRQKMGEERERAITRYRELKAARDTGLTDLGL